jgi:hypothetical protein
MEGNVSGIHAPSTAGLPDTEVTAPTLAVAGAMAAVRRSGRIVFRAWDAIRAII